MPELNTCLDKLYLEVFPSAGVVEQLLALPDGARIGITCSPSKGLDATLDLVDALQGHGFHLVPHIAARQVRDKHHLADITAHLEAHDVKALFVPGGDIAYPLGKFDSSVQLLRQLAEQGHSFHHLGVAAYPEGHSSIDPDRLLDALRDKQGIATYMVTQMCFDAQRIGDWLESVRDRGITLPAWIGLPGVMERRKLLATSMRIGVGDSLRFARKQMGMVSALLSSGTFEPTALATGIARKAAEDRMNIGGFYLFSFNQVAATIEWRLRMMSRGIDTAHQEEGTR